MGKKMNEPRIENDRVIIVHNHVFKNAGSTIDWALKKNFGEKFLDHRDDAHMIKGEKYLGPFLLENTHIKALSTHHLRPPLPRLASTSFLTIMMFRHPIERVLSVYNFEKVQYDAETLGAKFARNHTLKEYVEWRMKNEVPPTIRNFHIYRTLSAPVNWKKEVTKNELAEAKSYVQNIALLGLVDRFDESMVLFEEQLRPFFPSIDLTYKIQNVGQHKRIGFEEKINYLIKEIGEETYHMLIEKNQADIELFDFARNEFQNRMQKCAEFKEKLSVYMKKSR